MVQAGNTLNVLFTCVGRRVSLINSFRAAAKKLKTDICIYGADISELSPAMQICDKNFVVNSTSHPDYIKDILSIVKKNKIDLIVPTVDLDLKLFALNKDKFSKLACLVLVSSVEVVDICQDKRKTYKYLTRNDFDTPLTLSPSSAQKRKKINWPCFLKPWDGYASRGNAVVANRRELLFYAKKVPNCIVQDFIKGIEYTCDVYVDFDMKVKCVVPRIRLEIRAGEVSKARTVKNQSIIQAVKELCKVLDGVYGCITIQLFQAGSRIVFIEINPRFGGGYPLSFHAGANFAEYLIKLVYNEEWQDNMLMLRYDAEVIVDGNSL